MSTDATGPPVGAAEAVRRRILDEIRQGTLRPGERLGAERELATRYGVSRSTLRQALDALQQAGVVRRLPGRSGGTFINHGKVERDLSTMVGVPAFLRRQGFEAGARILSTAVRAADADTARRLGVRIGDMVFDLVRIRLADGEPIGLEHARLVADRFPGLLELPLGESVHELLERHYGTAPCEVTEEIEVVLAGADEARVLEIEKGDPLVSVLRTVADVDGRPFELSHDLFRADRTRIVVRTSHTGGGVGGVELQAV